MPLANLTLEPDAVPIPAAVQSFLVEAQRRIESFQDGCPVPGFVPCDFEQAYRVLAEVRREGTPGKFLCEWGSGFGVVACLAALLGFEAVGIEINRDLVDSARRLADDFRIQVTWIHGSFIPAGESIDTAGGFSWLETEPAGADMELGPEDFDVIFAYPWPAEEASTVALFERRARNGALLICCRGGNQFELHRKIARKSRS